jgi:hypothetical protein
MTLNDLQPFGYLEMQRGAGQNHRGPSRLSLAIQAPSLFSPRTISEKSSHFFY